VIILDTNVLSALMQKSADSAVIDWLDRQPPDSIWITSVTLFESRLGLALLPQGRRRAALVSAFSRLLEEDLENRVLDFDSAAATEAAELAAQRHRAGKLVDIRDTLIAGIALARRAALATRNRRHFADLRIAVIDPWHAAGAGRSS
jgi:predicted nucleic acid-binding protein